MTESPRARAARLRERDTMASTTTTTTLDNVTNYTGTWSTITCTPTVYRFTYTLHGSAPLRVPTPVLADAEIVRLFEQALRAAEEAGALVVVRSYRDRGLTTVDGVTLSWALYENARRRELGRRIEASEAEQRERERMRVRVQVQDEHECDV